MLNAMSLDQKIGQLFILAFPTKQIEPVLPLIQKYQIGGCYISQDNAATFEEAKQLTQQIQSEALKADPKLPLLLGVDQEGAWGILIPESTIGPGNLALGAGNDLETTKKMYQIFAEEMGSVGYQVNLAPCSDVNLDPRNPIIGTRSFGQCPELVAKHVAAAVEGTKKGGGISTAKHFPGHGDTHLCSHRELPQVDKPREELMKNEFLPFQAAIDAGVDLIMTSHILFPQIDPDYPTTLSSKILTDLLRHSMGFKGLIITDSMNMGAMKKTYDPHKSTLQALQAGADLVMFSEEHYDHSDDYFQKQVDTIESVIHAVKNGEISLSLIESKVERMIDFKLKNLQKRESLNLLSKKEKQEIEQRAAVNAIQVVKNENHCLPIRWEASVAVVNATPVSSYSRLVNSRGIGPNQAQPAYEALKETLQTFKTDVAFLNYEKIIADLSCLEQYQTVIAVTENYPLPGEDFETKEQVQLIQKLVSQYSQKLVVVGLRSPDELMDFEDVACYLTSHSSRTCSAQAVARFLLDN